MKKIFFIFILLSNVVYSKTWTDITGKYTTDAELIDFRNKTAYLKNTEGLIINVGIDKFCEEDKKYIIDNSINFKEINANVVRIIDGDTIVVQNISLEIKNDIKIRLNGIDAPEINQEYGEESKKYLENNIYNKNVKIEWLEKDKYERILGDIFYNNNWINLEIIKSGNAWHYKQYSNSELLSQAEIKAKIDKIGIWGLTSDQIPPWMFRNLNDSSSKNNANLNNYLESLSSNNYSSNNYNNSNSYVYITNTGKKYHKYGCRYLSKSSIKISKSEAISKGYTPCSICKP